MDMPLGAMRRSSTFLVVGVAIALSLQDPGALPRGATASFYSAPGLPFSGDQPLENLGGSLHGIVVDEQGKPIEGVEVELLRVDQREPFARPFDFTNERGEFRVDGITPGRYIVSIHARQPPSGAVPFLGVYHPGVDTEDVAEPISIDQQQVVELPRTRLRRVPTTRVIVNVMFEDGTRPDWSNLLVDNAQFPDGLVGGQADGMASGRGVFSLPAGFEYSVRAVVNCLEGQKIEFRESRPIQELTLFDSTTPAEWTFVIPGNSCVLWTPPK